MSDTYFFWQTTAAMAGDRQDVTASLLWILHLCMCMFSNRVSTPARWGCSKEDKGNNCARCVPAPNTHFLFCPGGGLCIGCTPRKSFYTVCFMVPVREGMVCSLPSWLPLCWEVRGGQIRLRRCLLGFALFALLKQMKGPNDPSTAAWKLMGWSAEEARGRGSLFAVARGGCYMCYSHIRSSSGSWSLKSDAPWPLHWPFYHSIICFFLCICIFQLPAAVPMTSWLANMLAESDVFVKILAEQIFFFLLLLNMFPWQPLHLSASTLELFFFHKVFSYRRRRESSAVTLAVSRVVTAALERTKRDSWFPLFFLCVTCFLQKKSNEVLMISSCFVGKTKHVVGLQSPRFAVFQLKSTRRGRHVACKLTNLLSPLFITFTWNRWLNRDRICRITL